jgi:hypothetical protein
MFDFSESLLFNRINPILSNFDNPNKKNKKEYTEVMKEVSEEVTKSEEDDHINLKI